MYYVSYVSKESKGTQGTKWPPTIGTSLFVV